MKGCVQNSSVSPSGMCCTGTGTGPTGRPGPAPETSPDDGTRQQFEWRQNVRCRCQPGRGKTQRRGKRERRCTATATRHLAAGEGGWEEVTRLKKTVGLNTSTLFSRDCCVMTRQRVPITTCYSIHSSGIKLLYFFFWI